MERERIRMPTQRTPSRQEREQRLKEHLERGERFRAERKIQATAEKERIAERKRKKLLIVDDTLAEQLSRFFRRDGIEVIIAKTRTEGIDKALLYRPNVVSLDNYMPYNTETEETRAYGTEIAMTIRERLPQTYIVGLSSAPESFDAQYFDRIFNKVKELGEYTSAILMRLER